MNKMTWFCVAGFLACSLFALARPDAEAGSPEVPAKTEDKEADPLPAKARQRIDQEIIKPLQKRRWEWKQFSRVRLPRHESTFEYTVDPLPKGAERGPVIAFRVTETRGVGKRAFTHVVVRGKYDTKKKTFTLARGANPKERFRPLKEVMAELGPRHMRLQPAPKAKAAPAAEAEKAAPKKEAEASSGGATRRW